MSKQREAIKKMFEPYRKDYMTEENGYIKCFDDYTDEEMANLTPEQYEDLQKVIVNENILENAEYKNGKFIGIYYKDGTSVQFCESGLIYGSGAMTGEDVEAGFVALLYYRKKEDVVFDKEIWGVIIRQDGEDIKEIHDRDECIAVMTKFLSEGF